jgi:hypothetical protein
LAGQENSGEIFGFNPVFFASKTPRFFDAQVFNQGFIMDFRICFGISGRHKNLQNQPFVPKLF